MSPPSPAASARSAFRLLFAALLTVGVGNAMLFALLPPLARQIGMPDATVGAIFSLSALLWVLSSPFWGRLSDGIGRKPVAAIGLAAYSASMAGFAAIAALALAGKWPWAWAFVGLMLARAAFGLLGSATSPAAQAYVADRSPPSRRTQQIASLNAAFALGSALGPGLCAWAAGELGLVVPIAIVAALAAGASYAVWRLLPEPKEDTADKSPKAPSPSAWRLATDPRVAPYMIYGLGLSTVTGSLAQTFAFYTMDRLGAEGSHGAELAAAGFAAGALALLLSQVAILPRLRLGASQLMAAGALIAASGVALQSLADSLALLMAAQAVQGLGFGLARPGYAGGASLSVAPEEQGALAGLVVAANGAGFIIAPLLGGGLYQALGPSAPLLAALALLAGMAAFALRSRRLKARP